MVSEEALIMPNPSLRDFLKDLEANHPDEVLHIREAVHANYFPTTLAFELQKQNQFPVLFFHHIKGFDIPMVNNIFGSYDRILRVIGCADGDRTRVWERIEKDRVKPIRVDSGPVKEIVVTGEGLDVGDLPIPRHFSNDAGRYITGAFQVSMDPDCGVPNLSYHRMQMKGPRKFGFSLISRGHLWDYHRRAEERGRDLEVAVVIGAHPAILCGAVAKVGMEVDEYEIAGALIHEPVELVKCETIDVYVPASAEIVLEGRILAHEREPEGPFGEYTGFSMANSTYNVFAVTAVTRREDSIYLDCVGGNSADHLRLARATKEMMVFHHLKELFPEIRDIHYPNSGVGFHCYISMARKQEGRARQALMHLFALDHLVKLGIVVDADIDVRDESEVLWSLAVRVQAKERIFVVPDSFCNVADPSAHGTLSDKIGIDATAPLNDPPQRVAFDPEAVEEAKRLLIRLNIPPQKQ